jgi:hypothetical protein
MTERVIFMDPPANNLQSVRPITLVVHCCHNLAHDGDFTVRKLGSSQQDDSLRSIWKCFLLFSGQQPVSELCLGCICEAVSNCNRSLGCNGDVCGLFRITWAYWADAGKPVIAQDHPDNEGGEGQWSSAAFYLFTQFSGIKVCLFLFHLANAVLNWPIQLIQVKWFSISLMGSHKVPLLSAFCFQRQLCKYREQ